MKALNNILRNTLPAFAIAACLGIGLSSCAEVEASNPHDTSLISITANFTPRSLYTNATYKFHGISKSAHNPQNTPQNHFLSSDGTLKEEFQGVELKDYR